MAEGEVKISALPSGSSLTGVEKIPMVQGGITIEASAQEIADLSIPLINSKQDRLAGIVSGCEITVETFSGTPVATNKQIKVSKGLALTNSWYIPTSEYSKLADTISSEITLCPTGGDFKYYDIVADNTNAITIHEGTPSTAPAHYVIDPLTQVLLGFITVGDAVIEEPIPVVSGFIPLSGSDKISGDLFFNASGKYIGRKDKSFIRFNDTQLYANVEDADNQAYISPSVGGGDANVSLYAGDSSDPTRNRIVNVQTGQPITVTGDVLLNNALNYAPSVSLASSTNPALGATASNNVTITGTTTIAGFDTVAEGIIRIVKFAGILQLTHSANLDLPSSANITTAVGDEAVFRSNGAGSWKCIAFMRKDGSALVGGGSFQTLPTEVTGSLTAANDKYYVNTASATYTDPTGVQGKGFVVLVRGGAATVGGTAYTTGVIYRYFNSAAWSNIMLRDFATITGDITFTAGVGTIANNAVTNAKAAQMAANTIKGNNTGSTANAADLTTDQFTAMMENAVTVGTAGILTALTSATYKYLRLTGCTGLGSIIAPSSSYKDLYIWNDTGVTLTLYHDYSGEATAANRIICGANRSWANNTMLHLKYSVDEARWCTVALDGNTFRALLAGSGTRLVAATSTGQEEATITTLDIDFSGAQQTSATSASWTGVNEVNISGLLQGQLYIDYATTGYRYECHRNDWCSRTPIINVEVFTTNSLYPILEVTGTSGTFVEDGAYVLNNASQVVMTLPTVGTFGKVIIVNAKGAGGGRINTSATQQIVGTSGTQPTAGQDISFPQHSAITLKCTTGHATAAVWSIVSVNPATTITII